jgi:hypothetical protein
MDVIRRRLGAGKEERKMEKKTDQTKKESKEQEFATTSKPTARRMVIHANGTISFVTSIRDQIRLAEELNGR